MPLVDSLPNDVSTAAQEAFGAAIANGMNPAAAMNAAIDAGSEVAAGFGFPPEVIEGVGNFFHDSFSQSIEGGMAPMDAFMALGQEDPITEAAHEGFEGAIANGMDPAAAMNAAIEAGSEAAGGLGIPSDAVADATNTFVDSFQSGLDQGMTPTESFNQCSPPDMFGTGDGGDVWADADDVPLHTEDSPPMDSMTTADDAGDRSDSGAPMGDMDSMAASVDEAAVDTMPPADDAGEYADGGDTYPASTPNDPETNNDVA